MSLRAAIAERLRGRARLSYLLLFAFSRKAFCNDDFFAIRALAAGIAAGGTREGRESTTA